VTAYHSGRGSRQDSAKLYWALAALVVFLIASSLVALLAVSPAEQLRAGVFIAFTASATVFLRAIFVLVADSELSSHMMIAAVLATVIGWIIVSTNWGLYREKEQLVLILVVSMAMLLVALILFLTS